VAKFLSSKVFWSYLLRQFASLVSSYPLYLLCPLALPQEDAAAIWARNELSQYALK